MGCGCFRPPEGLGLRGVRRLCPPYLSGERIVPGSPTVNLLWNPIEGITVSGVWKSRGLRPTLSVVGDPAATCAGKRKTQQKDGLAMSSATTWAEASEIVLREVGGALHIREIASCIIEWGLRPPTARPHLNVGGALHRSIQKSESRFEKVAPAVYRLRDVPSGLVTSFGMHWRRSCVKWQSTPQLWGQRGNIKANVSLRRGVYILHGHHGNIIYVGQSNAQGIGPRLYYHDKNGRLRPKWRFFSWFAIDGLVNLKNSSRPIIDDIEELLIAAIEPSQNFRLGKISDREYMQIPKEDAP